MAESSNIKMFQYPNGISNSDNQFYKNRKIVFMAITGQSLVDKSKEYYDTKKNSMTQEGMNEAKCIITLPMPNDLADNQQHQWEQTTYLDSLTGVLDTNGVSSKTDAEGNQSTTRESGVGGLVASMSAGLGALTNMIGTRKPMLNPGYFQNYSRSELRSFNFNYKFIPKNKEEAKQICEIVRAFKQYSSPQRGLTDLSGNEISTTGKSLTDSVSGYLNNLGDDLRKKDAGYQKYIGEMSKVVSGAFGSDLAKNAMDLLGNVFDTVSPFQMSPFIWKIIIFNDKIRELSQIKNCACAGINVSYGEGNFDTFEDGMPKSVTLSLDFAEMDLQFSNMYADAKLEVQSNNPNASVSGNVTNNEFKTKMATNSGLIEREPLSSSIAGNVKYASVIPDYADGQTSGIIDSITVTGTGILREVSNTVREVAGVATSAINEVHGVVAEATNTVRTVNNTIEGTINSARRAVRDAVGSVVRRVL